MNTADEQKKLIAAMVKDVADGIRVLNSRCGHTIPETDITERARNIVTGLIGNYVIKAVPAPPTGPTSVFHVAPPAEGQTGPLGPGPCPTGHPGAMGPPGEPR